MRYQVETQIIPLPGPGEAKMKRKSISQRINAPDIATLQHMLVPLYTRLGAIATKQQLTAFRRAK